MDVREKLVDILGKFLLWPSKMKNVWMPQGIEKLADHLVANGVTVQDWISVYDRLPQKDGAYLVTANDFGNHQCVKIRWFAKDGETVDKYDLAGQKYVWYFYDSECGYASTKSVTHWMPLPNPPKGE